MKIFPKDAKDIIKISKTKLENDLPICYSRSKQSYDVNITNYNVKSKTEILPFQKLDDIYDKVLFDNNGAAIDNNKNFIKNIDNTYTFFPNNATSYKLFDFKYSIAVKRNLIINSNNRYDIRIGATDMSRYDLYSSIFYDISKKHILKESDNNILVNSNLGKDEMYNFTYSDLDFVISKKHNMIDVNTRPEITDSDNIQDEIFFGINHIIIFDKFASYNEKYNHTNSGSYSELNAELTVTNPILNSLKCVGKTKQNIKYNFNFSKLVSECEISGIEYHNIFKEDRTPIIIRENKFIGYFDIIVSDSFIFDTKYGITMLYEALMFVYSISYKLSKKFESKIFDIKPNSIIDDNLNKKAFNCFSSLKLSDIFNAKNENDIVYKNTFLEYDGYIQSDIVDFQDNIIKFEYSKTNDTIIFNKDSDIQNTYPSYSDLILFKGYAIFLDNSTFIVEDDISEHLSYEIIDDEYIDIKISNFSSSVNKFNSLSYREKIPLYCVNSFGKKEYNDLITIDIIADTSMYIMKRDNQLQHNILLTVECSKSLLSNEIVDLRIRGGGDRSLITYGKIDKNYVTIFDNNSLIEGIPFRSGGTSVIEISKKYKQYDEAIRNAIEGHIACGEYFVVIYV